MFDADVVGAHRGAAGVLIFLACVRYWETKRWLSELQRRSMRDRSSSLEKLQFSRELITPPFQVVAAFASPQFVETKEGRVVGRRLVYRVLHHARG
jgi:hypothetical protein